MKLDKIIIGEKYIARVDRKKIYEMIVKITSKQSDTKDPYPLRANIIIATKDAQIEGYIPGNEHMLLTNDEIIKKL